MKKNVASQSIGAQMITAADGSDFTSAVTVYVTGDSGTQAAGSVGSGACTHEGNGYHSYIPAQAETNYAHIAFTFKGTGAISSTVQLYTEFPQTVDNATALADIQARIPAALVSGRIDSSVGAMASNVITSGAINAAAMNGKGDWPVGKTGYSLTQTFPTNFADLSISVTTGLVNISQTAADKVWGTAARLLTAGTNIALAKGTGITGFNDLDAAAVAAGVWNAATATYGSAGSYGLLIETNLDAAVSSVGGGSLTAAAIADAVWDEVLSGHLTGGSTGAALNGAGAAGDPWGTALPGAYSAGSAGYIMGTNLNATVSSRATQTSVDTIDDFLDTEIAAIKAKTDNLPSDPADASDIATSFTTVNTKLDTIDDYLDTEIAAIKAETASIQTDTNDIQTRIPAALVGGRIDASLGAIDSSTTALAAFKRAVKGNVIGTVGAASTTTSVVSSALTPAGSVSTQFKGRIMTFADDTTTAALRGQSTDITASTASATPTFTVTALTTAPVSGDTFSIT